MNQIALITPAPDVIDSLIRNSIIQKFVDRGVLKFHIVNLRNFGSGNYQQIDDKPFGGGSGMVMMAEPLINAVESTLDLIGRSKDIKIIYPSPQGETWCQKFANQFSKIKNLIFICGHYKGIDERVIDRYNIIEYSLGDFVITNGEIPAMVMVDSAIRLIPGALNSLNSALTDTFTNDLLDHPHYTHPRDINGLKVPDVLVSGNHKEIENWKQEQREKRTKSKRPDLWKLYKRKLKESEEKHG